MLHFRGNHKKKRILIDNYQNIIYKQSEGYNFVGSTRIWAKKVIENYQNIIYKHHSVEIPYDCCETISHRRYIPDLKPLKLNKMNVKYLIIIQHRQTEYTDELDKFIKQPFVKKHMSWFTIFTIVLIISLIVFSITCKCRRKCSEAL